MSLNAVVNVKSDNFQNIVMSLSVFKLCFLITSETFDDTVDSQNN